MGTIVKRVEYCNSPWGTSTLYVRMFMCVCVCVRVGGGGGGGMGGVYTANSPPLVESMEREDMEDVI